jgi:hypothetical protein
MWTTPKREKLYTHKEEAIVASCREAFDNVLTTLTRFKYVDIESVDGEELQVERRVLDECAVTMDTLMNLSNLLKDANEGRRIIAMVEVSVETLDYEIEKQDNYDTGLS